MEYLALFLIVLLHGFGHGLACRPVGGTANQIVPLGGVACVVWGTLNTSLAWAQTMPNAHALLRNSAFINLGLLIFNMLPIYPQGSRSNPTAGPRPQLDGATVLGFVGVAGLTAFALATRSAWRGILCAFILVRCGEGLREAQALSRSAKAPRQEVFPCPQCKVVALPTGAYWVCGQCKKPLDTLPTRAICPHCAAQFATTACLDCGGRHPLSAWSAPAIASQES